MAGGTHIFLKGQGFDEAVQFNQIMFTDVETGEDIPAPMLTEDDAFNSHPVLGHIAYRIPALWDLLGQPEHYFDNLSQRRFVVWVAAASEFHDGELRCTTESNCRVDYKRIYTPSVFYVNPPVVYYDSYTNIWYDPKSVNNLIADLETDELPFINAKIGGALLDFEFTLDYDMTIHNYYRN